MPSTDVSPVKGLAASSRIASNHNYLRLRVSATVSGTDSKGRNFAENATTVLISRSGAALECVTALPVETEVVIRIGSREAIAKVVGQTRVRGVQALYAISLLLEEPGFWGIHFPGRGTKAINEKALQCLQCELTRLTLLDDMELLVLENNRRLRLSCDACQCTTDWKLMIPSAGSAAQTQSTSMSTLARKLDERRWTRIAAPNAKACIRGEQADEIVTLVNISRGGACFESTRQYPIGAQIQIAAPYAGHIPASFLPARVLRITRNDEAREYAVEFL